VLQQSLETLMFRFNQIDLSAGNAGQDDHDRGLHYDLERLRALDRRRALGLLGAAGGTLALAACGGEDQSGTGTSTPTPTPTSTATATPTPTATATSTSCTAFASETNGPYPADGTNTSRGATSNVLTINAFQRSDIRTSLINSTTEAPGVLMQVTLTLANVNSSCAPLAGYAVYLWHCDATGQYSLYDLPAESYLRGIQVSDANGQVTFTTIVPGCYAGRYPHIHFEVFSSLANATSGNYAVLISQLAIPAAVCEAVYADSSVYGASLSRFRNTSIASDNIFGDNSSAQTAVMTLTISGSASAGYSANTTVGIAT
jgi:protocatechuate 3,4-dioxygenase beta subunit